MASFIGPVWLSDILWGILNTASNPDADEGDHRDRPAAHRSVPGGATAGAGHDRQAAPADRRCPGRGLRLRLDGQHLRARRPSPPWRWPAARSRHRAGHRGRPHLPAAPGDPGPAALTVQAALDGRLVLGIGLSHQIVIEGMFGYSFDKPARHMREYLDVLLPLLHEGRVSFSGETVQAQIGLSGPREHTTPVLLAALAPQMLRLAGSVADGTVLWMTGPRPSTATSSPSSPAAAEAAGRPAPRVVCTLPVCVNRRPRRRPAAGPTTPSPSTGSSRRTGPCSTSRARPGRATSPSSATRPPWPARSPRSATSASPTSPLPSSGRARTPPATRALLLELATARVA